MLVGVAVFDHRFLVVPGPEDAILRLLGAAGVLAGAILFIVSFAEARIVERLDSAGAMRSHATVEQLRKLLSSYSSLSASGVTNVYWSQGEAAREISELIAESRSRLDILGATLRGFLWDSEFRDKLAKAVMRNVKVRIIILNPGGKFLSYYADQQGMEESLLKTDIEVTLEHIKKLSFESGNRIEVRLLDQFPIQTMSITEKSAIMEIFSARSSFRSSPQIYFERGSIYQYAAEVFDELWEHSVARLG
jgi:hypothetical protein